jgi:PadR family transcriptional regulator, regulatory protein PadR
MRFKQIWPVIINHSSRIGGFAADRNFPDSRFFWTVRSVSPSSAMATPRPPASSLPIDTLYVDQYYSYRSSIGDYRRYILNSEPTTLLQGTLDLLILKSLVAGEMHGLGISRRIQQITGGTFVVKPGSLFPALHRMDEEGWISSFWGDSENNRRAKYYRLTKAGRKQLEVETKRWGRVSWAIAQALEAS